MFLGTFTLHCILQLKLSISTSSVQSSSFCAFSRYIIIQEDRNPFLPSFNHKNLKETSENLSLLIIAKTKMNRGHCYLGLNLEDEIIYRPIYKEEPGTYESNFILFFVVFREKIILTLKYFFCCMVEQKNQGSYIEVNVFFTGNCCWPRNIQMDVGQYYGFDKTFRDPDTSYPHKNNDLVVKEQFKKGTSDTHEN